MLKTQKVIEASNTNTQAINICGSRVLSMEAEALATLSKMIAVDTSFTKAVELMSTIEGRVIVTGMGKSGHIARKIAATMSSTGTSAFFVHPSEASHGDMGMIVRGDVVLSLSNSGESKELNDIIEYTRRFGIPLIAITKDKKSTLGSRADIVLKLADIPEVCPNGLAPTTSTTMSLALGDALSLALLEQKGFTANDYKVFHPGGKLGQQLMQVDEIMHSGDELPLVDENTVLKDVFDVMTEKGFGCAGIINTDGEIAGIITDGDIRRHIDENLLLKAAKDIMTTKPQTVLATNLVGEAMGIMNNVGESFRRITCLFVVDTQNKPVGIIHLHDCLKAGFA